MNVWSVYTQISWLLKAFKDQPCNFLPFASRSCHYCFVHEQENLTFATDITAKTLNNAKQKIEFKGKVHLIGQIHIYVCVLDTLSVCVVWGCSQ